MNHRNATIELLQVSHAFGDTELLHDICYTFHQGMSYSLSGPSGSGKSTLLNIIAGIETPKKGAVLCNGADIAHYTQEEHRAYLHNTIGLIFQHQYLIHELSVLENVMLKGIISKKPSDAETQRAHALLVQCRLENAHSRRPGELSGGEQQRIAVARALFLSPAFIIADEPTAHLDNHNAHLIMELLRTEQERMGFGIIMTTHNPAIAALLNSRLTLVHGQLYAA